MSRTAIDFSIIVISFNTKEVTNDCLKSVWKFTNNSNYEIIVVDNGSTDGSLKLLKKYNQDGKIRLVDAKTNLGFGKANNKGASLAKGKYLLFLNSDTLFENSILENIKEKIESYEYLGVYSCKLKNKDNSPQGSGGYFPNLFNLFLWQLFIDDLPLIGDLLHSVHPSPKSYHKAKHLDWVTGAFMIIPKTIFDQSDGFDEKIFMYTEEMELCFRIQTLGLKTIYDPTQSIIHLGGASGGSVLALTSEIRNMLYFWGKHKPRWQYPLAKTFFFIGSLLRFILFGIIKKDEKARLAYSTALKHLI